MPVSLSRADGLHILTKATLQQLIGDESLRLFADGLIPQALTEADITGVANWTVAEALHHDGLPPINALISVLFVLDAEVQAIVDDESRVWPLPGYLSYRSALPIDRYPLNTLRLPPLNPDGHYRFVIVEEGHYLAVRMDIHPKLKVAGHIRIAIGGPERFPERILALEHRLERQELKGEIIVEVVSAASEGLSRPLIERERAKLIEILRGFV